MTTETYIQLKGTIMTEPEVHETKNGNKIFQFVLALKTDNKIPDDNKPIWMQVVCFGDLALIGIEKIKIGGKVIVDGELRGSRWLNEAGERKAKTVVVASRLGEYRGFADVRYYDNNKED